MRLSDGIPSSTTHDPRAERKRAAVVQFEAVHEEVMPTVCRALILNGVQPTVFANARILENRGDLFSQLGIDDYKVNYAQVNERSDWDELKERIAGSGEFDLLVLNTFQREGIAKWSEATRLPILGVVHSPRNFLTQPTCVELVQSRRATIMTLAPHVTAWLMDKDHLLYGNVATIPPVYWGDQPADPVEESEFLARRRIAIPGAVNFGNRDYPAVLETLAQMSRKESTDALEFVVLGGGVDREKLENQAAESGLGERFYFAPTQPDTGFVDQATYLAELVKCSFVLPLLPENKRDYRLYKISAALSTLMAFAIPALIDRWTEAVYGVPCISYPAGQMAAGLQTAASIDYSAFVEMKGRLTRLRDQKLRQGVDEMAFALSCLD
jgi:hypothetical protein